MPLCYGTWRDEEDRSWGLLLERLDGMALMDAADDASAWTDGHIATAIDGMAELHAAWLGRDDDLVTRGWIGHVPTSASTTEMAPLWAALANHAAPMFATWADAPLVQTHAQLVNTIARLVAGPRGAPSDADPQRLQPSQCRHPPHDRRDSSRRVRLGARDDRRAAARSGRVSLLRTSRPSVDGCSHGPMDRAASDPAPTASGHTLVVNSGRMVSEARSPTF